MVEEVVVVGVEEAEVQEKEAAVVAPAKEVPAAAVQAHPQVVALVLFQFALVAAHRAQQARQVRVQLPK